MATTKKGGVLEEEPPVKASASHQPPSQSSVGQGNVNVNPDLNPDLIPDREPRDQPSPTAGPALPTVANNGAKGTHFAGPVCSRQPVPGLPPLSGETPLLLRYFLDNTDVVNFPIQFPLGSVLWRVILVVGTAYNGTTPKLAVGSTLGGTDILNATIPAPGVLDQLVAANLPASGKVYVNVTGASTAGAMQVMFMYAGKPALKWN